MTASINTQGAIEHRTRRRHRTLPRRRFLAALSALGGSALLPGCQSTGGVDTDKFYRVDFSHSGGVTPFLLSRFQREKVEKDRKSVLPNALMYELRKFYYDTAQGHHEGALKAPLEIIPTTQVLYGSDYPFWDGMKVRGNLVKAGS